ncbi:MAG: hypothetical protein IKQ97_00100 [Eubacterium sp.]|nr:hypothetical protein [Eubacterium sp.]
MAATLISNSEFIVILKQSDIDSRRMQQTIGVTEAQLEFVKNSPPERAAKKQASTRQADTMQADGYVSEMIQKVKVSDSRLDGRKSAIRSSGAFAGAESSDSGWLIKS